MTNENIMTLEELRTRIDSIAEIATMADYEVAHIRLDELVADFIKYVASVGSHELKTLATEMINSDKLKFTRWYA